MKRLLVLLAVFPLTGCLPAASTEPLDHRLTKSVRASWYDEGRLTATGEHFKPDGLTAAMRKPVPFNSHWRVTHHRTGKSVVVRINDRGPFIRGRDIDLSRGAAEAIGLRAQGVGLVDITRID